MYISIHIFEYSTTALLAAHAGVTDGRTALRHTRGTHAARQPTATLDLTDRTSTDDQLAATCGTFTCHYLHSARVPSSRSFSAGSRSTCVQYRHSKECRPREIIIASRETYRRDWESVHLINIHAG